MAGKAEMEMEEVPGQTTLLAAEQGGQEKGRKLPQFLAGATGMFSRNSG